MPEPFVGREDELKSLRNHLEMAYNYQGRFVLIQGDIGVGKTRFLSRFVEEIGSSGAIILTGRSLKDEISVFYPFTRMLEDYLENIEYCSSWLVNFLEPEIAPYLVHLIPKFKNLYPLDIPQFEKTFNNSLFFYSFQRFFEKLSKSKPLILILDDVQWLGTESIELLQYLVPRISNQAILILAASRPDKNNLALQKAIDEFSVARLISTINLDNLSKSEVEDLLNQKFKNNFPNQFAGWLYLITKGNPLFVQEILSILVRQNIIAYDQTKDEWSVEDDYIDFPLSATVESVISYRLGHLAPSELRVLENAAVMGETFDLRVWHKLLRTISKQQFQKSCNVLTAAKLIEGLGNTKQFCHPLIRNVIYQKMDRNKRRNIHRKLTGIFKEQQRKYENLSGQYDEEIAYHITKDLEPQEETQALARLLFNISKNLLDRFNYPLAWQYLKIAQRIAAKFPALNIEGMKIKSELNYLSRILGRDVVAFEEMAQFAKELETFDLKSEAARHYHILFDQALIIQNLQTAEDYLDKAISLVEKNTEFYWTLMVERCLLQRRKGLLKEAIDGAKRLIAKMPPQKNPVAFYKALNSLGMVSFLKGELESAMQTISRAQKIVEEYSLLPYFGESLRNLGLVETEMGRLDSALIKLNDSLREAELFQRDPYVALSLLYIAHIFCHQGEFEKSTEYLNRVIQKAETLNNPRMKVSAQFLKVRILFEQERLQEAEKLISEIIPETVDIGFRCDYWRLKSTLCSKKHDLNQAEKFADMSLKMAKNSNLELRFAIAWCEKASILWQKGQKIKALKYLENAKAELLAKGAIAHLSTILVNFGVMIGGLKGETIFLEGLKMLFDMRATKRIESLHKVIKKKKFNHAFDFIQRKMPQVEINKLEIFTFGGLSVKRPGELDVISKKEWLSRKAQELLGLLLVLSGSTGVTREILAVYLWPEANKKKSQLNFRVALTHLNRILGNEIVIKKGQFLMLNKETVRVDCWIFEELFKEWQYLKQDGKLHPAEDRARKAIALYKGDLMPEFYCTPIVNKQLELEEILRNLLLWLAKRCIERLEWQDAIFFARRVLTLEVNDESAHQIIIEGLYTQGDRTSAIRQFERLKKSLKEELNAEPSLETMRLYRKITTSNL